VNSRAPSLASAAVIAALVVLGAQAKAAELEAPSRATVQQAACADAFITSPVDGEAVQGQVPIFGSALIDDFNFYKIEVAPAHDPGTWNAVSTTINRPVENGLLDVWDTVPYDDADYFVKLTVVDPIGQEVCRFTLSRIRVSNVATPSPSPSPSPEQSPTPTPTFALDLVPTGEPTVAATIDPVIPITDPTGADSTGSAAESAQSMATDAMVAFMKGFLLAVAIAGFGLLVMAFRR
jgi:hypothetical protein